MKASRNRADDFRKQRNSYLRCLVGDSNEIGRPTLKKSAKRYNLIDIGIGAQRSLKASSSLPLLGWGYHSCRCLSATVCQMSKTNGIGRSVGMILLNLRLPATLMTFDAVNRFGVLLLGHAFIPDDGCRDAFSIGGRIPFFRIYKS